MNKSILLLSLTLTFPLYADLCLNRAINKWRHGDNYANLATSETRIFPGISWEKTKNTAEQLEKLMAGIQKAYPHFFEEGVIKEADVRDALSDSVNHDFLKKNHPLVKENKKNVSYRNSRSEYIDHDTLWYNDTIYEQRKTNTINMLDSDDTFINAIKKKCINFKRPILIKELLKKIRLNPVPVFSPTIEHFFVGRQYKNDCGGQAIKNAYYLLNDDTSGLEVVDLKSDSRSPFKIKNIENLESLITEDLDGQAIHNIAKKCLKKKQYTIIPDIEKIDSESFDIREFAVSFNAFSDQDDDLFEGILDAQRALRTGSPFKLACILGDMDTIRMYGHWATIVVEAYAQGNVIFKCADSFNETVAETAQRSLIKLLKQDPCQLHMARLFEHLIPNQEKYEKMGDPVDSTLKDFKEIIRIAAEHNYAITPQFQTYLDRMLTTLNDMANLHFSFTPLERDGNDHKATIKELCDDIAAIQHPDNPYLKLKDLYTDLHNLLTSLEPTTDSRPAIHPSRESSPRSDSDWSTSSDTTLSTDSTDELTDERTSSLDD